MIKVDCLVIGAGFSGATIAERCAGALGRKVLVLEQRDHIGGNAYDCRDNDGVHVHTYGPHIFHTNATRIWEYLSRFTQWRSYEHKVMAQVAGRLVPVPFNLNSLHALFPPNEADCMERLLLQQYGEGARVPILKLRASAHGELQELADYVYRNIFLGYSIKQWNLRPEQLSPSVTARVPVVVSRDDRYFQDTYQAMPLDGYTALFQRMLDHSGIEIQTGVDFFEARKGIQAKHVFYTGPIDAYFDFRYGKLPYRSLKFMHSNLPQERYQSVGTVNFPNDHDYTRITEFKHISGQRHPRTSIVHEYPCAEGDPYYPIPCSENEQLYRCYRELAQREHGTTFVGRLANYRYYNMDQVVAAALSGIGALS